MIAFSDSWQSDVVLHKPLPQLLIDSGVLSQTRRVNRHQSAIV